METRTILQIALGVIILAIGGMTALLVYSMKKGPERVVVKEVIQEGAEKVEKRNPWADQGDAAIQLVKSLKVTPPLNPEEEAKKKKKRSKDEEEVVITVGKILEDETFIKDRLKITGEPVGWTVQWWGETKHGPTYYLVRYELKDANILLGPEWLVDLKARKIVAKNLPALVTENPSKGMESEYYDKKQQIVSAIANHRFDNGMSLAGALLLYFEQRSDETSEDDTIVGWTIDHETGNLFKAYFQWVENQEPTYAEFEFDYDKKALKPVNLQAANIMRVGEAFDRARVSIMPAQYDPSAKRASQRWKGGARKACAKRAARARCKALATILDEAEVVESLEWLLTARANAPEDFENCKEERQCSWIPESKGEGVYNVKYSYNLGSREGNVSWDVNLKSSDISPTDRISQLAYSVIRPR